MTNQQKLEQLKSKLIAEGPCSELALQATQLVFGSGNPNAEIVFVGEAPGKKEDETGESFVGASGKFLDEMLAISNLDRSDIYITNIVKYRPPNNRDPKPEEKAEFWPYLTEQINIIKPRIIATLGRHSGQAFIKSLRIGVDHGKPVTMSIGELTEQKWADEVQGDVEKRNESYEITMKRASQASTQQFVANLDSTDSSAGRQDGVTFVVLPLYHPAAALYNGALRQTLLDDFTIVNKLLKN